jgi:hypothetical protein
MSSSRGTNHLYSFLTGVVLTLILVSAVHKFNTTQKTSGTRDPVPSIQLEGAIPVEVASNAVLSNWQDSYTSALERCWRGVTYVVFFDGRNPLANVGGSAVILPDGKPLLCDTTK